MGYKKSAAKKSAGQAAKAVAGKPGQPKKASPAQSLRNKRQGPMVSGGTY